MSSGKGRPAGSKNVNTTQILDTPRCPGCGKTDRTRYRFVGAVEHGGFMSDGREYTHVVSRRTRCLACEKVRIDKFFENRSPEADPGEENEPDSQDENRA